MDADKEQIKDIQSIRPRNRGADTDSFVLEKSIFNNVFNKDIQRIYLYKKAERLAKALNLIVPAFSEHASLRERLDQISMRLVDAVIGEQNFSHEALSRELLALSSILTIAQSGGILSPMNAEVIARECHILLQEAASYEAPRITLEEAPTIATLARGVVQTRPTLSTAVVSKKTPSTEERIKDMKAHENTVKGHIKDKKELPSSRREAILSILKKKSPSYIKDISNLVRDVSEKTIQRELQALVVEGVVSKSGERRWTQYSLV